MIIYWGYPCGGKAHMSNYAIINNKTWLSWRHTGYAIRKKKCKVNYYESNSSYKGIDWIDLNIDHVYYHKNKKFDSLVSNTYSEHKIERYGGIRGYYAQNHSIISKDSILEHRKKLNKEKKSVKYKQEHVEKYTTKKYLNTLIYHEMLSKHRKYFCEQRLSDNILREHYDEIFDGVDLVTHAYMWTEDIVKSNLDRIRKANNIIPFKSNKLHQTITFLDDYPFGRWDDNDGFWTSRDDSVGLFDAPKEKIWAYLDEWHNDINITKSLFKKFDIPYQLFDLDSDSYKDMTGWEIQLPRTYDYLDHTWDEDKYKKVEIIAKEYLSK